MVNVLIADNDPGVRGLLCEVVRRQGLAATVVADGEAAQAALAGGTFAVLICDLDMPRRTGLEVLSWLATQGRQPAVLVVSGYVDARIQAQLDALSFVRGVLRKPFDVLAFAQQVLAVVRSTPAAVGAKDVDPSSATGATAAAAQASPSGLVPAVPSPAAGPVMPQLPPPVGDAETAG